jgi:hypothetical protein
MKLTITFNKPETIAPYGKDSVKYSFPFSIVPSNLKGTPEENKSTEERQIIVSVAKSRLPAWHLSDSDLVNLDSDLVKILFWFGKCHICELISSSGLPDENTIQMPMLSTANQPNECPFDPAAIPAALGFTIEVNQAKPRIGF